MNTENGNRTAGSSWMVRMRKVLRGESATREDLLELLAEGRWRTVLGADELTMLRAVLEVSETKAGEVMIPRSQMVVLERAAPREEVLRVIVSSGHSRFPVIGDDRDEVIGILLAKDLLRYFVETVGEPFDLARLVRPATFIPESKRLNALLKEFRMGRNHLAIVVDEYGGVAGLLTIEDVLEEIVGEIGDEFDPEEAAPITKQDDNRYNVRALTRIEEFNEFFDAALDDENYDTIGGLVIHELAHLPRKGETVQYGAFQFKVLQADRRRIHSLEVTRVEPGADGDGTPS